MKELRNALKEARPSEYANVFRKYLSSKNNGTIDHFDTLSNKMKKIVVKNFLRVQDKSLRKIITHVETEDLIQFFDKYLDDVVDNETSTLSDVLEKFTFTSEQQRIIDSFLDLSQTEQKSIVKKYMYGIDPIVSYINIKSRRSLCNDTEKGDDLSCQEGTVCNVDLKQCVPEKSGMNVTKIGRNKVIGTEEAIAALQLKLGTWTSDGSDESDFEDKKTPSPKPKSSKKAIASKIGNIQKRMNKWKAEKEDIRRDVYDTEGDVYDNEDLDARLEEENQKYHIKLEKYQQEKSKKDKEREKMDKRVEKSKRKSEEAERSMNEQMKELEERRRMFENEKREYDEHRSRLDERKKDDYKTRERHHKEEVDRMNREIEAEEKRRDEYMNRKKRAPKHSVHLDEGADIDEDSIDRKSKSDIFLNDINDFFNDRKGKSGMPEKSGSKHKKFFKNWADIKVDDDFDENEYNRVFEEQEKPDSARVESFDRRLEKMRADAKGLRIDDEEEYLKKYNEEDEELEKKNRDRIRRQREHENEMRILQQEREEALNSKRKHEENAENYKRKRDERERHMEENQDAKTRFINMNREYAKPLNGNKKERSEEEKRVHENIEAELRRREEQDEQLDEIPTKEEILQLSKELSKPQHDIAKCLGLM